MIKAPQAQSGKLPAGRSAAAAPAEAQTTRKNGGLPQNSEPVPNEAFIESPLLSNILQSSTQYSVIGKDLDGGIVFWNEGARRLYGYGAEEVIGKVNSSILHTPENIAKGLPRQMMDAALSDGKWEGVVGRVRKNERIFDARIVLTPRLDSKGQPVGFLLISKDVSEESREIREREATQFYTRSLIESNIDALVATDPLGIITDVNQQMERLTSRTRDELVGSRFKEYFTEPPRAEEAMRLVLREGKVTAFELTLLHADAREVAVSYNASTFVDEAGRLQRVFSSLHDLTNQKGLELQLSDSQAYYRGWIEASVHGLTGLDTNGTISDVNDAMCRMSGYSREELLGTPFSEYFSDFDTVRECVATSISSGSVTNRVLTLATRDGHEVSVLFNSSLFKSACGEVLGIFSTCRDITDQTALQLQLGEERSYNRGLIEASNDGLIIVDPMIIITDVNDAMCRMSGYTRVELIGSEFQQYFADSKRAADGVRLTLDRGGVTDYELGLLTKDGREALVSFNAAIFKDPAGGVRGIFASARDITEQAALQQTLANERAYNRGQIEASVDGLVTVDQDLRITDVNEQMCRMAGRTRNQLIGSLFPRQFTEPERASQSVCLALKDGTVTNYLLTLQAPDGTEVPISLNAVTFADTAGVVRGIFAAARNTTDQKQLEAQLHSAQTYTRSLIESNIDPLMTTDPLGIITDINAQMEALTGCSRDDLIGSPVKNYFTDPQRAQESIRQVLREGKVTNYELTALSSAGTETVVSYNASTFLDETGRLKGVLAAARVITEQKKLEQHLRDQQTYLRGLIESSSDGLIMVDPQGIITDVNDRMCRMTGYERSALLGTPFADYFSDPIGAWSGVQQAFEAGFVTEYALTIVSRTRRRLQVSFNASVYRDETSEVRGILASARDVTDQMLLEEKLREQQSYLRGLIESSVDGLLMVDPEGYITDINEQMCRMTMYTREKLVGSLFKRYFAEPDRAEIGMKRTLAEGGLKNYELVMLTSAGRKAVVSFNASVYRGPDGNVEGIFASARDVSEQYRLQTRLVEQQAYNRSLFEASADALFAIAPDGIITDVNAEATRLTGYSRKHLINSQFKGYFTVPEAAKSGAEQTLADGRVIGYLLELITRNGRRISVSFNAGVFSDTEGAPLGILAAFRDISEQKQLETQLQAAQTYTRSLIESNIDALMTTDPLGIITDVNHETEALTGRTRDELIGTPFKDYFTEPDRAENSIRLVLSEGRVTDYELTARSTSGFETVVSYNAATLYDHDGKLQGVLAAARDVTERKRFDATLHEKNLELEGANFAKDRFLTSMSHELRTPLNAIIGFTGTLLMGLAGPLTGDQEKQLKTIKASGNHLLSLINDLLDLAKIESGKVTVSLDLLPCSEVIEEVATTLRPVAAAKGLGLFVADTQKDLMIRADRRALSQILINLVNNSIKFTERGSVRIEAAKQMCAKGAMTTISVVDTGAGIAEADQSKLFEAFTQLALPGRIRPEGTGLGLHLSQKLAKLMSGTITFESRIGEGATFTLTAPGK